MMDKQSTINRALSALAYLSILFLPVLLPLIITVAKADDRYVRIHARLALFTQLSLVVIAILLLICFSHISSWVQVPWWESFGIIVGVIGIFLLWLYNLAMAVLIFAGRR